MAGVLYEDWNSASVVMHIRGEPGWACRQFLAYIFDYPFVQLGVKRITAPINSTNFDCIRMVSHMGLTHEATLKNATTDGDLLIFRMFKDDCKYLKGKYAALIGNP